MSINTGFVKKIIQNRIAHSIGSTSVVIGLFRLAAIVASVLLARDLSEADFGEFTLVRTLILVIPPIAIWGQNSSVTRFFSKNEISDYNWRRDFFRVMSVTLVICLIAVAISAWHYQRAELLFGLMILLPTFGYCVNMFLANILRSQKKYMLSLFINEGFRIIYLVAILLFISFGSLSQGSANWGFSISLVVLAIYAIGYCFRTVPCGKKAIPKEIHQDAIILWIIAASVDIIGNLDRLLIGGHLSLEELALYAAVFTPLQIYMIFNHAANWVLVPVFGRQKQVSLWKYSFVTLLIALAFTLTFILVGQQILHLLYDGKFDHGSRLMGILAISQAERMFYTMASSLIVGRLRQVALRLHMWFTVISVTIHIIATYLGVIYFGIWGVAYATIITHSVRLVSAYGIVWIYRDEWSKAKTGGQIMANGDITE